LPLKLEQAIDSTFQTIQRLAVCVHFINCLAYKATLGKKNDTKSNIWYIFSHSCFNVQTRDANYRL